MVKTKKAVATPKEDVKPLEWFDMHEIYRLIHLEAIPGFQMLKREREYLADYRKSLHNSYQISEHIESL